jgi:hypothetical protein
MPGHQATGFAQLQAAAISRGLQAVALRACWLFRLALLCTAHCMSAADSCMCGTLDWLLVTCVSPG